MDETSTLTDALFAAGMVAIFFCGTIWCLYRVVTWARRRSKRAYVIGAALAPLIALGSLVDPDMRIVQEAKRLKKREEDNPGDPPASDDESIVRVATELAAEKDEKVVREDADERRAETNAGGLALLNRKLECSFCGKPAAQVAKLVAGRRGYICDACAAEAHRIMSEWDPTAPTPPQSSSIGARITRWFGRLTSVGTAERRRSQNARIA